MMARWIAGFFVWLFIFPLVTASAQRGSQDEIEGALRELPPAQRAAYRRQLLQLDRVSRRLLQAIPNPPQVNIVFAAGEESVNAGTTFGKVIVSEGMLDFVKSDDELAMILGHELAHQTLGHVSRGAMNSVLLNLGSVIAGSFIPGGEAVSGLFGQMVLNHFNQDQERTADHVGLRYAYDAGYDPQAAAYVMRRMAEEVPETAQAGFFSSHPSSVERFATLQREAEELSSHHAVRRTESVTPGPKPVSLKRNEKACRQARPFFYQAQEAKNSERRIALYQRGLRLCPQSPRAHAELAEIYAAVGEHREAVEEYREALRYDPDYPGVRNRLAELEGN
jgi:predicted Zn-dependent protease